MQRIEKNAARCKKCGEVLESKHRNDIKTCVCGNLTVDGGHDYIRRGFRDGKDSYEDLNEYGVTYECCPGWWAMLDRELKGYADVYVKEKWGRADVYCGNYELEERLHKLSGEICELCGSPGKVRNDRGWVQCRCDRCHSATKEERNEIMRRTQAEYEKGQTS